MSRGIESGQGYFLFNHSLLCVYLIPGIVKHWGCGNEQSRLQSCVAAIGNSRGHRSYYAFLWLLHSSGQ